MLVIVIPEILNSSVTEEDCFSEKDAVLISTFLQRLPGPVCLISYEGNKYDFYLLRKELHNQLNTTLDPGLKCVSLRKAVCAMQPGIGIFELDNVFRECTGQTIHSEDTAEHTVSSIMKIFSSIPGITAWIDMHNQPFNS